MTKRSATNGGGGEGRGNKPPWEKIFRNPPSGSKTGLTGEDERDAGIVWNLYLGDVPIRCSIFETWVSELRSPSVRVFKRFNNPMIRQGRLVPIRAVVGTKPVACGEKTARIMLTSFILDIPAHKRNKLWVYIYISLWEMLDLVLTNSFSCTLRSCLVFKGCVSL